MICRMCRQPVYFEEKAYVKLVPHDGQDVFYHISCFESFTGLSLFRNKPNGSMQHPVTALGEAV